MVRGGGDWTLQRLVQETDPAPVALFADAAAGRQAAGEAEVILDKTIDALDITVLRGGGDEVGLWAKNHGFGRCPTRRRSSISMPTEPDLHGRRVRCGRAAACGQAIGDGTPVHLTIPTDNPWVLLRILGLGKATGEAVEADVYLLTDRRPAMLIPVLSSAHAAWSLTMRAPATDALLTDLRSDVGMEWVPNDAWLTAMVVDSMPVTCGTTSRSTRRAAVSPRPSTPGSRPSGPTSGPRPPVPLLLLGGGSGDRRAGAARTPERRRCRLPPMAGA